jgi:hypothetical protein
MTRRATIATALALCACASMPAAPAAPPACDVSAEDRAWIEQSLEAWRFSAREITGVRASGDYGAVFFDAACVLVSPNALSDADGRGLQWTHTAHGGTITLPNGDEIPAGVTSFTLGGEDAPFFVMSAPSVWRAGGVRGDPLSLEALMTFVVLHEGSHVAQVATYGARVGALAERNNLSEDFNDDSMQHQFGETPDFAASVAREIELFVQAAASPDDAAALQLAREARALMRARAARHFIGDLAYYAEAEDIWLTFEGSGQWAGYRWLVHPEGMALDPELARRAAMRSRWWSQNEGLAIALVLDRLGPSDWHETVFGNGARTLLEMLDATLADSR